MPPRAPASRLRTSAARAAAILGVASALGCRPAESATPWEQPRTLAFRLTSVDGRVLHEEPPGGRHLVVFFAASDDLRSLRQLELWEREARAFTSPPACIVVAMDRPEAWPLVRLFGERMAPRCAVVHAVDELRANGGPFAPVTWVPEVIVYDPLGHEVLRAPGGASGEAIAKAARAR
jgi:hypothetical protein